MPAPETSCPISAVLFDLDGTLLDTAPDFHHAINLLRAEERLPEIDFTTVRNRVSDGAAALIQTCFSSTPGSAAFNDLQQRLLSHYLRDVALKTRPFDGIVPLLDWLELNAIQWGIVTNKPQRFTTPLLEQLNLSRRCATVVCADQLTHRKPHPEGLLRACQEINCDPETSVYVGDHRRDIEAGARAGMITIAALYGYISSSENPGDWQADIEAASADEILQWARRSHTPVSATQNS